MSTYHFGVVEKLKLLVRMGCSHYGEENYNQDKEMWERIDWDYIDEHINDVYELANDPIIANEEGYVLTVGQLGRILKAMKDGNDKLESITSDFTSFCVWWLFRDGITKIVCESSDAYDEYIEDGYQTVDWWSFDESV